MKRSVIVTLQVEGIHCWKDAKEKLPEVSYLASPHRHMFHITAEKEVMHDDRDVEFITLKRQILNHLTVVYGCRNKPCDFGGRSCEMLAEELFKKFDLESCTVMEDNENGSKIIK